MGNHKSDASVVSKRMSTSRQGSSDAVAKTEPSNTHQNSRAQMYLSNQQMISAFVDLSWKMGLALLIPLFVGSRVDAAYDSSPNYAVAGFGCWLARFWCNGIQVAYQKIQAILRNKVKY
jgi:hypothetical protein